MNKKKFLICSFLIITIALSFVKCKKENDDIGADLISDKDRINTSLTDTVTVAAYTQKLDKIQTNDVVYALVGNYIDPIFGETKASFATQMLMSNNQPDNDSIKEDGITADSLIIYFKYPVSGTKVYGDADKDCKINISKINTFLDNETKYYSNYDISALNATMIHSHTFNPKTVIREAENLATAIWQHKIDSTIAEKGDTSKIKKEAAKAVVAIKMPDNVSQDVYTALIQSIKNNATFVEEFNGLYFSFDDTENSSISVFDYISADTKAVLYYHKNSEPAKAKQYPMFFNQYTTRFSVFNHEFSSGNILADFNGNTQDSVIYLQGLAGLSARIKFPYIDEMLKEGKWVVNKAELVFTVPQSNNTFEQQYPAPDELMLYRIDANNQVFNLDEFFYKKDDTERYYGELYTTDKQYVFDITLFMQRILRGEYKNNELLLSVRNSTINPSRVVIGANNNSKKIKLKLVASKL